MTFNIALVGIEGFGRKHAQCIRRLAEEGALRCAAFADPAAGPDGESYRILTALGAAPYKDLDTMLAERTDVDAVVIATPLALHKEMAVRVMNAGKHALVEKPPAVTVQDVDEMIRSSQETGKLCAVNFQNISGSAFQEALSLVSSGAIGRLRRIVGIGMWNRTESYYRRTPWAGKLTLNGRLVLDGTLMNPFAHLMQNCLLLAQAAAEGGWGGAGGASGASAADLCAIESEMYHANPIEGDDNACVRMVTRGGAEICMYTTLCHETGTMPPTIEVVGDEGALVWYYSNQLKLTGKDGKTKTFEYPEKHTTERLLDNMYRNLIDAAAGKAELFCSIERARSYIAAAGGALMSSGGVHAIPEEAVEIVEKENDRSWIVPSISEIIREAAEKGALFSEIGVPWAVAGQRLSLENFREFRLPAAE